MNISTCLHPVKIYPLGKDFEPLYVPCGQCLACKKLKHDQWAQRLEAESKIHKYNVFLTLTYSDSMIPHAIKTDDGNLVDPLSGEYFDIKSYFYDKFHQKNFADGLQKARVCKDVEYYNRYSRFNYSRISDVSDMFKRVRTQLVRFFENEKSMSHDEALLASRFRYFAASEYGTLSFRPHAHIDLWFDSPLLAEKVGIDHRGNEVCRLEKFIRANWSINLGTRKNPRYRKLSNYRGVDFQFVKSSVARYISKYVTCNSSLPALYEFPAFKTKHVQSSRPPIGFSLLSDKFSDYEIFEREITQYLIKTNDVSESSRYVQLPSYITGRIFRKCPHFGSLTFTDRISFYGFVPRSYLEKSFSEFKDWYNLAIGKNSVWNKPSKYYEDSLVYKYLHDPYTYRLNDVYLQKLYTFSKSVQKLCISFGVSLYTYVKKVDSYYKKIEYENLKRQLEFEEEYVQSGKPLCDLLFMFPNYMELVLNSTYFDNFAHYRFEVFASFGIDLNRLYVSYSIQDPTLKITKSKIPISDYYGETCTINPIYKNLSYLNTMEYWERQADLLKYKHDNDKASKRDEYYRDKSNPKFKNYRIYG